MYINIIIKKNNNKYKNKKRAVWSSYFLPLTDCLNRKS